MEAPHPNPRPHHRRRHRPRHLRPAARHRRRSCLLAAPQRHRQHHNEEPPSRPTPASASTLRSRSTPRSFSSKAASPPSTSPPASGSPPPLTACSPATIKAQPGRAARSWAPATTSPSPSTARQMAAARSERCRPLPRRGPNLEAHVHPHHAHPHPLRALRSRRHPLARRARRASTSPTTWAKPGSGSSASPSATPTISATTPRRPHPRQLPVQRPDLLHRPQKPHLEVVPHRLPHRLIRPAGDRIVAASLYDGVLVDPNSPRPRNRPEVAQIKGFMTACDLSRTRLLFQSRRIAPSRLFPGEKPRPLP
jgi:hypothetical protein